MTENSISGGTFGGVVQAGTVNSITITSSPMASAYRQAFLAFECLGKQPGISLAVLRDSDAVRETCDQVRRQFALLQEVETDIRLFAPEDLHALFREGLAHCRTLLFRMYEIRLPDLDADRLLRCLTEIAERRAALEDLPDAFARLVPKQ
ncbi:hypothetical protein [Kitasatospora phosalacinea]|uniref:Uncharacterized protein n=1 Tax=Kitasatospora phosalacinea TaxID=2065 RepID=A0A9W6UME9_9ACTN|nr:hypothetical protein [Kitasatospora phosalacinea]GLW52470.1 hypothetical protein Kpho01_04810 [Kitasatospora phosalacinea]